MMFIAYFETVERQQACIALGLTGDFAVSAIKWRASECLWMIPPGTFNVEDCPCKRS